MRYQDIQIKDEATREQFLNLMDAGQYQQALNLLTDPTISFKAKWLNDTTDRIVQVEQYSDTFKADRIKVANTPPANLPEGKVYFQLN